MNTKMCRKCGIVKSVTEFHKSVGKKDNYHSYCKKCAIEGAKKAYRNLNQKEWMLDQANDCRTALLILLDEIKIKYKCAFCGESCPTCLVFHHINPKEKTACLSKLAATKNFTKTLKEINKCIVLCSNCHLKFHAGVLTFNENKRCNETLEDFKLKYEQNKVNIRRKKREKLPSKQCNLCGKTISRQSKKCKHCHSLINRKIENRPSLEQLQQDVKELGYCGTGRKHGVTDNAIRKWIKSYRMV